MAKNGMTLQDAYILLQISKSAGIDEVKQAYRKRAFALHPDLHPDNENAAHEFQRVNEAYVTVIAFLDSQAKKNSVKAQFVQAEKEKKSRFEEEKRKAEEKRAEERRRKEKEREERIERERREMERRQARERAKREEERRRRLQEEIDRQEAKKKARQEEERLNLIKNLEEKAQEFKNLIIEQMEQARKERESREKAQQTGQTQYKNPANAYNAFGVPIYNKYQGNFEQTTYKKPENKNGENTQEARQEERNTSDNTSYVHIRPERDKNGSAAQTGQNKHQKEYFTDSEISANKENSISQAIIKASQEPLEGLKKGISSWFKSQIDEELELYFPAARLQPGVKMRLQFRVGLANELQTIELTLPKDFVPGKPLRLKGLGKKIGKWQGDLYLKLQSK